MSTHASVQSGTDPAVVVPARRGPLSGGLGVIVVVLLLGIAGFTTYRTFTSPPVVSREPQYVDMICAKTLKPFRHLLTEGESPPVYSPHSKERTGWPAEKCYWNKDGTAKLEPDLVLLNEYAGKSGPTLCPVCGRLVVAHNPLPSPDKIEAAERAAAARTQTPPAPSGGSGHAH